MGRLVSTALLFLSLPAAASANPAKTATSSVPARTFQLPAANEFTSHAVGLMGKQQIGPNAHFGLGMFGLKAERALLQSATGSELRSRKQRRAGVGISLKF